MSLETEVAALTEATTNLLTAVNVSKATLDQKVTDAGTEADAAAASAATATTKANESASSAASALAIYGNTTAMNSAVASATTSANTATTKATEAANSAASSAQSASEAEASAASAAQIVYGNLIMHPNRIDQSISIPDGYNAFFIDPVEFGPNVTVTGLGNSTLRGV